MSCERNTDGLSELPLGEKDGLVYSEYLHLDTLLNTQHMVSRDRNFRPSHDEHLFIITHQAYELWFKQILYELDSIQSTLANNQGAPESKTIGIIRKLHRIVLIIKLLLDQITILETMTPLDFNEFREYLSPASGFQSLQFRLIENKLGVNQDSRVKFNQNYLHVFERDADAVNQIMKSQEEPSLLTLIIKWLEKTPGLETNFWLKYKQIVKCMFERQRKSAMESKSESERTYLLNDIETKLKLFETIFDLDVHNALVQRGERKFSHKALQAAIMISFYRDELQFSQRHQVLSLLMDIDALLCKWRFNHMLLVQRMIGSHSLGTGGSAGYQYLRTTLTDRYKVFVDICNISAFLPPHNLIPPFHTLTKSNLSNGSWRNSCYQNGDENLEEIDEENSVNNR